MKVCFFVYSPSVIVILFRGTAVYLGLRKHDTIALDFVVAITTVAAPGHFFFFFFGHLSGHENPKKRCAKNLKLLDILLSGCLA